MKKTKLLFTLFAAFSFILRTNAQFYMNSAGQVSIGSTSAATGYYALQSYGSALFSQGTSGAVVNAYSTSYTSPTSPDYTWNGDSWTGLYHPATDSFNISIGGNETMALGYNQISGWCTVAYGQNFISHLYQSTGSSWVIKYGGNTNFYVYATGAEWAKSNNIISDVHLKTNINTIDSALSKVLKLRGVTFTYKPLHVNPKDSSSAILNTGPNRVRMGVIAQEVARVCPEVVDTGKDSIMGVQYANLVGLLIEAVKAQNRRIDSLKNALIECCNKNHDRSQRTSPDTGNEGSGSQFQNSPMQQGNLPQNLQGAMLYQNTPNPFTQSTTIACYIPQQSGTASIMVFDMNGTLKKTFPINGKGSQNVVISGNQLIAGMYFYTLLIDNNEIATKKMILTQ